MRRPPISPFVLGFLVLPGCPSPSPPPIPGNDNPKVLWLAPDMNETHVKLVDTEPGSY